MQYRLYKIIITFLFLVMSFPASARCAVCYTNGMSGASIAVLIILSFFIILYFANLTLKKLLDKNN